MRFFLIAPQIPANVLILVLSDLKSSASDVSAFDEGSNSNVKSAAVSSIDQGSVPDLVDYFEELRNIGNIGAYRDDVNARADPFGLDSRTPSSASYQSDSSQSDSSQPYGSQGGRRRKSKKLRTKRRQTNKTKRRKTRRTRSKRSPRNKYSY